MITIIATIKPEHLGNIRRGVKLFEMRKTCPKEVPFRVLCCESGSGGQINAEFICRNIYTDEKVRQAARLVKDSCVTMEEAEEYAKGKPVHFWHISEMIDYCSAKGQRVRNVSEFGLKRAPQSWCYVKEHEYANT